MIRKWESALVGIAMISAGGSAAAASKNTQDTSPVVMEYYLPKTVFEVSGALIIRGCEPKTQISTVDATFETRPVAIRGPGPVRFTRNALSHGMQDTVLSITTDANGVLSSVNGAAENRGPEVLGNIAKLALKIVSGVGFLGADRPAPVPTTSTSVACTSTAQDLTSKVNSILKEIEEQRRLQSREPSLARAAHIEALQREAATIQQTKLRLPWSAVFELDAKDRFGGDATKGGSALVAVLEIAKTAFSVDPGKLLQDFDPARMLSVEMRLPPQLLMDTLVNQQKYAVPRLEDAALILPSPVEVSFEMRMKLENVDRWQVIKGLVLLPAVPIPQWGPLRNLPLRETFGRKRGFQAQFDPFGRATSVTFTSNSRAAAVTGGLAGVASDVEAFAVANSPAARAKAEAAQLENEQKRNRLRACKEAAGNVDLWWDCDTLLKPQPGLTPGQQ